jgi:hypothetical protein
MNKIVGLFVTVLIVLGTTYAFSQTLFTAQGRASAQDTRLDYDRAALRLSLEKTVKKYGPFKLVEAEFMNTARGIKVAKAGRTKNFFTKQSVSKTLLNELGHVPFPIDLGIVGYRVFFVSPNAKSKLKTTQNLGQLKKFSIGQGVGWLDVDILEHNGFKVIKAGSYEGLFKMVAKNRFDLYSRGTNELLGEWKTHKNIQGFAYDESVALYYPLPRFFFTNKANKAAIKRVTEGLIIAYNDGSLKKEWEKHYRDSIDFVNLKKRKIFRINNPFLEGVDSSYEKYIYKP